MEKVIYRHPKGRFEVVEREYRAMDGGTYTIREAMLTPRRDLRGFASEREYAPVMPNVGRVRAKFAQVTSEERDAYVQLFRRGESVRNIADAYGRNPETVRSHLRGVGVLAPARKYWKESETRRALALWRQGMSYKRIAAELGKTPHAVIQKIERLKNDADYI